MFLLFRVLKLENILGSMRPGADSKEKVTQYIQSILICIKLLYQIPLYLTCLIIFSWFVSKLLNSGFSELLNEQLTYTFLLLSSQKSCSCNLSSYFVIHWSFLKRHFLFPDGDLQWMEFCSPSRPAVGIF